MDGDYSPDKRYYVDLDDALYDEQGLPNTSSLLQSFYVVDSAPHKPYGVRVAEYDALCPFAEEEARAYCARLNRHEEERCHD